MKILVLKGNGLQLSDLVLHRFSFHQAAAAFETFVSGQSAEVLLEWEKALGRNDKKSHGVKGTGSW